MARLPTGSASLWIAQLLNGSASPPPGMLFLLTLLSPPFPMQRVARDMLSNTRCAVAGGAAQKHIRGEASGVRTSSVPSTLRPNEMVCVEVRSRAGECVGTLDGAAAFRKWKRQMQQQLGGVIAFAVGDKLVIDRPSLMDALSEGTCHAGVLLQKAPLPAVARRQLAGCDLFKAI